MELNRQRIARMIRKRGVVERLDPAGRMLHQQGVHTAIDAAGRPVPEAFRPILPSRVCEWESGESGWRVIPRAGRAMVIYMRAQTAPTTGTAICNVTWESPTSGETFLSEVTLTVGSKFGVAQVIDPDTGNIGFDLDAGSWVYRNIVTAQGATGINVALIVEAR